MDAIAPELSEEAKTVEVALLAERRLRRIIDSRDLASESDLSSIEEELRAYLLAALKAGFPLLASLGNHRDR